MSPKRLLACIAALALSAIAAAPYSQHAEALFPWWESLTILLLVILLVAVLILWNARQPLEYDDNLSRAQHGGHEQGDGKSAPSSTDELEISA